MSDKSVAHRGNMNHFGEEKYADGLVSWSPATPPDLNAPYPECRSRTSGRLRSCGYCGSMHPADVAAALKAGARMHWADQKYGWPHKVYIEGIPNPFAGQRASFTSCGYGSKKGEKHPRDAEYMERTGGEWVQLQTGFNQHSGEAEYAWHQVGEERATRYEKFYSVHLQDATPEDREVIERAMRRSFLWHEGKMWYGPYTEGGLTWEKVQEGLERQGQQA